jgi:hypothetical protein
MYSVNLFLDFQDWRLGSRGFSWYGTIPPTKAGESSIPMARALEGEIRGAHFWPFDQDSLGPDIPCYLDERNQGLVLDRKLQRAQIDKQEALVSDLLGRIEWLEENIEWADMGPVRILFYWSSFLSLFVMSLSLSQSISACLYSPTLHDTSLTIIPHSINHQSTHTHITYYLTGTAISQGSTPGHSVEESGF